MDKKTTKRNLWMFPLGTVGRDMIYQLFNNFILTFILFTKQLTVGQLGAITGIMIAARIFDALNDPVMGNIIDRTRTKWGKFKPWLLIGILTTSIVVYLAFNTDLQGWSFVIFFGIIYFAYSITYTMHDISYWGMVPSLSRDAHTRNQFTSRANLFAGIGGTLASVLIPLLTTGDMALGGNAAFAFGRVALIICVLAPLFLCFTIFGARENRSYEKEPAPPISFKKIISVLKKNDQLLWMTLIFLIQQVGQNIVLGGVGSNYIYFEFGYQGGYWSLFTTVGMAATAFLMVFYPAISKKIDRKPFMAKMLILATVGYVLMFATGAFMPSSMVKFWAITIGYMMVNFGFYSYYLIMMISILNTVEYNEYKNGERNDAIIASIRPFVTKLGSAVVVGITYLTYVIFGVTTYTNQISEYEQQVNQGLITEEAKAAGIEQVISQITQGQRFGLLLMITIVPLILMILCFFLYKNKYKLDEKEYDRICAELEAKKQAE